MQASFVGGSLVNKNVKCDRALVLSLDNPSLLLVSLISSTMHHGSNPETIQ